mmetsp:Transcript_8702/g.24506  ORF Transcript_8702/g.24506 Transcript_8702/m.24506 type:complete len:320 (+) Transcript_8702:2112-3071(+)
MTRSTLIMRARRTNLNSVILNKASDPVSDWLTTMAPATHVSTTPRTMSRKSKSVTGSRMLRRPRLRNRRRSSPMKKAKKTDSTTNQAILLPRSPLLTSISNPISAALRMMTLPQMELATGVWMKSLSATARINRRAPPIHRHVRTNASALKILAEMVLSDGRLTTWASEISCASILICFRRGSSSDIDMRRFAPPHPLPTRRFLPHLWQNLASSVNSSPHTHAAGSSKAVTRFCPHLRQYTESSQNTSPQVHMEGRTALASACEEGVRSTSEPLLSTSALFTRSTPPPVPPVLLHALIRLPRRPGSSTKTLGTTDPRRP